MYEVKHQSLGDNITDSPFMRWLKGDSTETSSNVPTGEYYGPPAPLVYYGPPAPETAITSVKPATSTKPKPVPVAPSIPGSPGVGSSGNMLNWIIGGGVLVMGSFATWLLWPRIKQSFKGKKG